MPSNDPRDVYVSDLIRFIAATAADLPLDKRRALMLRFFPWVWERESDGRVKLLVFGFDDIGADGSSLPTIPGFLTVTAPGLAGDEGGLYDADDERRSPWAGSWRLHEYLLRLRDAGVLL